MRNGLYKVEFTTPKGAGSGVVTLSDGKMGGGDSVLYYRGTYAMNGNSFTATVQTDRHTVAPAMPAVFGQDRVNINVAGTFQGDVANMTGTAKEAPGVNFKARLSRLAD